MKFFTIFILFLAFSQISINICGSLTRNHRYRRTRTSRTVTKQAKNKWYQFLVGVVFGMAGQEDGINALGKCIPLEWNTVDTTLVKIPEADKQDQTSFDKIMAGVKKVATFACKFKSQIMKLIGLRVRRVLRRSKYRMFSETGLVLKRGWFDEKVTARIDKVKDWANQKWEDYNEVAQNIVDSIKGLISQATDTIKGYFSKETWDKLLKFFNCALPLLKLIKGLYDVVSGIISKATLIASIAGHNYPAIAKLIVDLLCNFELFNQAFNFLFQSFKETDTLKKFSLVGKFMGLGFRALVV